MYATKADIIELYGADVLFVADRDGDGVPEDAAIDRALTSASAEIDGYVGVRYDLPLAGTHDMLRTYAVDIAIYRLAGSTNTMSDELRQRFEDAIKALKEIAAGRMRLTLPADPDADPDDPTTGTGPNPIVAEGPERLFSRDKMRGL